MMFRHVFRVQFAAVVIVGLSPAVPLAQDALPWSLAQFPQGGPALTEVVATTLGENADLTAATCTALGEGTLEQAAGGFAGIALAVFAAPERTSIEIIDQIPDCCDDILSENVDTNISLGVAIALEARAWGESEIGLGQEIEHLVGLCGDPAFVRSYEIARGEDELGTLIAEGSVGEPATTGSIPLPNIPGGGLPSAN